MKKNNLWIFPLFSILFAFYYAVLFNIRHTESNHSVSIKVSAKIEIDDTLHFNFNTHDFGFSNNNSKKISVAGSPEFQDIVFAIPDFVKVKNIKLILGSNKDIPEIDITKITIQKNSNKYVFNKNDISIFFPLTKGFRRDSFSGKFLYYENDGVLKPYFQSRDISTLYESVRQSTYRTPKIVNFITFVISLLTTLIIFLNKNVLKEKLSRLSYFKPVINILKYKIELNRFNIMSSLLILLILYVFILGNINNNIFGKSKGEISEHKYDLISSYPINNLIYNGNFEYGLKFWTSDADTSILSIINTPFGKGVRIHAGDVFGKNWFLKYSGRPIVYYPGHKYKIKFKYKIINGNRESFKVGWSVKEKLNRFTDAYDLKLYQKNLGNNWYEAYGEYLFNTGHTQLDFFLHSLKDSSVIDITDVCLVDLCYNKNLLPFLDQIESEGKKVDLIFSEMVDLGKEQDNILYNGNFKYGLLNWWPYADSTTLDWVKTPYGSGVRVSRTNGCGGHWSLFYIGPKIEYKAKVTYHIEFKFRIIKGDKDPFNVGWWVNDNGKDYSPVNLALEIIDLKNGWYSAKTKYTFINSHIDLRMLINSFEDNTIVEFTDIRLKEY